MGIVKRQSAKASIATYIGVFIGYVNLVLLFPKFLSPEQLGLTRLLISLAVILSQVSSLGMSLAILRFFPYLDDKKSRHHGFLSFTLLVSAGGFLFFFLLLIILRTPIQQFFLNKSPLFVEYYFYLFPIAFFMMVFELLFFYTRALFKTVVPTIIREIILRLLQTLALILLIMGQVGLTGFLILFVGSYLLYLLVVLIYLAYLGQLFVFSGIRFGSIVSLRQIIRYSGFMFAASLAWYYTSNIDQVLLAALSGLASNAIYSIAFFIGTIIQIPGRAINQVVMPIISDAWKRNDVMKLQQLYSQTSLNELIIGGFIFLIIWTNVDLLLGMLPAIYQQARWVILIIGIGKLLDLATGINGEILMVSKHVKASLFTFLLLIVVATVANYMLIPLWGVNGAAVASAFALVLANIIRMSFLYYKYTLQPFNMNTLKASALLCIGFAISYFLPSLENPWLTAFYKSILITAIIVGSLIIFRISSEINTSFHWMKSKLYR